MDSSQNYYKNHGPMTAPGVYVAEFAKLPKDIAALCEIIQGVLIHRDMAPFLLGVTLSHEKYDEAHIRGTAEMLTRIHALDARVLTEAREPRNRMAGVCRHFSTILAAILREQGIAARARCGFAAYFTPGKFEDHWVCEYWNTREARWIMVDAQMDSIARKAFHLDFDPLDVPRDRFIVAGYAWQMCKSGRAAPQSFGLSHIGLQGLWFVAGNVLRDLASLNRMEMLPWDVWGLMPKDDAELTEETRALFDRISSLTLIVDDALSEVRDSYEADDRIRVPSVVFNALRNAPERIALDSKTNSQ